MLRPEVFRLPKAGSTRSEYEDAVAWTGRRRHYAVADGASASAFARLWAQLLVHAYTAGRLNCDMLEGDLQPVQTRWANLVDSRPLPWYAAEQARRGAFAALIGLSLHPEGVWSALAVGDCCLFHIRGDSLLTAFPLCDPEAFDNQPLLIGSRAAANRALPERGAIKRVRGSWQQGDTFLLMSDALAAAFLRLQGELSPPLAVLDFTPTQSGFRQWVHALRAERMLRNDDVSLLWLSVDVDASA